MFDDEKINVGTGAEDSEEPVAENGEEKEEGEETSEEN